MLNVSLVLHDGFVDYVRKDSTFLVPYNTWFALSVNNPTSQPRKARLIWIGNKCEWFTVNPGESKDFTHLWRGEMPEFGFSLEYSEQLLELTESCLGNRRIRETTYLSEYDDYVIKGYHLTHNKHCGRRRNERVPFDLLTEGCKECEAYCLNYYGVGLKAARQFVNDAKEFTFLLNGDK